MIKFFEREDPDLEAAIAEAFSCLTGFEPYTDEYSKIIEHLKELQAMRKKKSLDPNTALIVAGNLAVGFAVIKYERVHVISTKLWSFLMKTG